MLLRAPQVFKTTGNAQFVWVNNFLYQENNFSLKTDDLLKIVLVKTKCYNWGRL